MRFIVICLVAICLIGCNKKVTVIYPDKVEKIPAPVVVEKPKPDTTGSLNEVKRVTSVEVKEELRLVYFDFDRSEIRYGEIDNLAAWGKSIHGKIVLAGYCDERGSAKYNFGLGQRRAVSVMRWLRDNGVRSEIRCVSYGKGGLARTGCGDDEDCHQQNRRVEFKVEE